MLIPVKTHFLSMPHRKTVSGGILFRRSTQQFFIFLYKTLAPCAKVCYAKSTGWPKVLAMERGIQMPVIKISLTQNEYEEIAALAENEKMTIQDYIRYKIYSKKSPSIFVPEEAESRALRQFSQGSVFSLPDIYADDWSQLNPRMTGVFGRRFFKYIAEKNGPIQFLGMSPDQRRATYTIQL